MIHKVCKDIISGLRIDRFVETGTFVGETMARVSGWMTAMDPAFGTITGQKTDDQLAAFCPQRRIAYPVFQDASPDSKIKIFSVDIDAANHQALKQLFAGNPNINIILDSSDRFLERAIGKGTLRESDRCLFYLDAHWGEDWPLRREIVQVLRLKRSVIVIDDFVVPWHPWHGFDAYKTRVCGWYYISDLFKGKKIDVFYPKKANDDGRGTVIIFVGYQDGELKFMDKLPCFRPFLFRGAPLITLAVRLALSFLVLTGLYPLLLKLYLSRKWGSLQQAPMKSLVGK